MNTKVGLVTGGAGFLGRIVADHLVKEMKHVRRMVRRPDPTLSGDVISADLLDRMALRRAVRGIDVVVHLGGRAHIMGRDLEAHTAFRLINVEGTQLLLEEAVRAGVKAFIFFSSVKAVGEQNSIPWTEAVIPRPRDPYGISKLEGEELVRECGARSGMHTSILRLPLAYGPGMKGNMIRLFDAVKHGVPLPLRNVSNSRSMVFSGNVAEAVSSVLRSPRAIGETFFVSDGADLSTPDLLRGVGVALGKTPNLFPMPEVVLSALGCLGDIVGTVRLSPVNSDVIHRLVGSLTVDISKLRALTGYAAPFSVQDGLRETATWYGARHVSF
ncbi:MAG: NAD-dependent epimerase/dehydratase family protein [Gemmatimonadaceae bacterium]